MLSTLRRSLLVMFCASISFILAGIGFQRMNEYDDFVQAAQNYSSIGFSLNLVYISAVLIFLVILLGNLPIVSSIIESAHRRRHYGPVFLLAVPVLAFMVFVGTIFLLKAIFQPGNHLPLVWRLFLERGVFLGVILAVVVASVAALSLAARRTNISTELWRFSLLLSTLAIPFMVSMVAAQLIWGLSLHSNVPQLFNSDGGIFASSTAGSWLSTVILLSIIMLMAIISALRGFSAIADLSRTSAA